MSDSNKILDVSYGTFSCRLEGFDDSVETMKTVVTFFHELAGHDRFMDMAPQAPDLATLAELTARQTGTPVDVKAETETHPLHLRAQQPDTEVVAQDEERPSLRVARDTAPEEAATETNAGDTLAWEEEDIAVDAPALRNDAEPQAETDYAEVAQDDTPAPIVEAAPAPVTPAAVDTTESVAAKLQRIRAVVGRSAATETSDTYAEDLTEQTAPQDAPAGANPLTQRLAELAKRNAAAAAEETDTVTAPVDEVTTEAEENLGDAPFSDAEPVAKEPAETPAEDDILPALAESEQAAEPQEVPVESVSDDDQPSGKKGEDDFDLAGEVAEIERTIAMRRENHSKRQGLPGNVDAAISRILSQADQRLNEPEGRRQRDAFAQLKAAVAATEAARQLGDPGADARDPGEAFREDLDAHEAEDTEAATDAPADRAPLRLVPAQRVDETTEQSDRTSDRLRKIASQKDTPEAQSGGFAEFAAKQGASELAELLEAAAAYIEFVEGDDDFSRPQVMKKVQLASSDEISREDGLRSFGRLLRQSKIIKLNNGRFQVSKDTRFRPDDKIAQG
ncbi:hypothetical protein [Yoonia sp.]|uniref:hypothetical protein n=1 Tax=Yoonia sp. TaxID=2212373 RepID=UPI003F6AF2A7